MNQFSTIISILALTLTACGGADTGDTMDAPEPGLAVADLALWGLEECPGELERAGDYCVAGTVDVQLEIDDCNAVAKCLPAGAYSCAKGAIGAALDRMGLTQDYYLSTPREYRLSAPFAAYITVTGQADGLRAITDSGIRAQYDADGTTECLIDAERDVVLDHWKWSKVRAAM